jgi:predicted transcriptional regulator
MTSIVCMVGNDFQRILDGVNHWKMEVPLEKIYLLFDNKKDKYGYASQKNAEELVGALTFATAKPAAIGYNPQSFENVFCTLYKILTREIERLRREVLIDTTSTTKEAYGATVTISLMFRNVRIYIVPPQERGWYIPSPEDEVFKQWFRKTRAVKGMRPQEIYLPGQRLKHPNVEEKMVLLKLHEHGGRSATITSLITWCSHDPKDPVTKNRFSRILKRLENNGFVEKKLSSVGTSVSLTHFGRIFAEAMR